MTNTENKDERKNNKRAISISAVYGFLVLLFLFLFGFRAPFPPFEEEGILVNFGNVLTAKGPSEVTESKVVEETPPPEPLEETKAESEKVVTQEHEESIAIPEPEKETKKPEPAPKPKPEPKPKVEPEVKPEKKEMVKEKEIEEPEAEINPDALFSPGTVKNKSEGTSEGKGNMGETDGVEEGSGTSGLGESGIGFSLAGRDMVGVPQVDDDSQKEGKITVKIQVNRNGNVIRAEYTLIGSTISDPYLKKIAIQAAEKAIFNSDKDAPEIQQGTITFVFKLK